MSPIKMTRREALRIVSAGTAALAGAGLGSAWTAETDAVPSIITRKIPSSGETLPVIGLGTWQTFDVDPESAERRPLDEVLQAFADLGGKACGYLSDVWQI